MRLILVCLTLLSATAGPSPAMVSPGAFAEGLQAYRDADYARAAQVFARLAAVEPAAGTLQNLGNSLWQRGDAGRAILAWEQARWLAPGQTSAAQNLRFARKLNQLEAPELTWYEVISTWLPASWWAIVAMASFWCAVAMALLPSVFRQRKATWHQAVAALGVTLFLLSVPAQLGVITRSRLGFVLEKETPLRLTPTAEAQVITRLAAGEPARWQKSRGNYVMVRTGRAVGWLEISQFGLVNSQCAPL
jgi:hypothetical protein